jgi:hypothetical protein
MTVLGECVLCRGTFLRSSVRPCSLTLRMFGLSGRPKWILVQATSQWLTSLFPGCITEQGSFWLQEVPGLGLG